MKRIILLIDYKGNFGSKWDAVPYNSGFDKKLLKSLFNESGYEPEFISFSQVKDLEDINGVHVLYTSSEDIGYHYKDFIEDIVYYLQLKGAIMIPSYDFLRANNNKAFMELLRDVYFDDSVNLLKSWSFGTYEEMHKRIHEITYPIVIKTARGALSRGVSLAHNEKELISNVKDISRTKYLYQEIKDSIRPLKHKEYKTNSLYRNKFILQTFVPDLKNDWKILIFGKKYFILTRHVAKNDFRASGSHENYLGGSKATLPEGLFDYAEKVQKQLNVPHLSIDVVYDGVNFYLVEFQALYFGTSTINMSDVCFFNSEGKWLSTKITESVEELYTKSVIDFLKDDEGTIY